MFSRKSLLTFLLFIICPLFTARADEPHTLAKQAILLDAKTGVVLFEKNADELMHPSSMTKMMVAYLLFDRLSKGILSFEDTFLVSKNAWLKKGSRMFCEVGKRVHVNDLLRGIIVQSGNDASIVVAEGLMGRESLFAGEMTRVAHDLGATQTQFKNATGWPDPGHISTARDLAKIAKATQENFPQFMKFYQEKEFTYNHIRQTNRNPLLWREIGKGVVVTGMKTGHTSIGGFGLTATLERGDQSLILVVNGFATKGERASESERIVNWALRSYNTYRVFAKEDVVASIPVWGGSAKTVDVGVDHDLFVTIPLLKQKDVKVELHHLEPVPAPVKAGVELGYILVQIPDQEDQKIPLKAKVAVDQAGFFARIRNAFKYLIWGHHGG